MAYPSRSIHCFLLLCILAALRSRFDTGWCGAPVTLRSACLRVREGRLARVHLNAGQSDAEGNFEYVSISMPAPLSGRVGVNIQSGRRTVSSLAHEEAFANGWRIGDVIVEVNGLAVADNDALKAAVRNALDECTLGRSMRFRVKRSIRQFELARGMLRMTPGTGGGTTVPMIDLIKSLLNDFPIVIFLDGTITYPGNNLSAKAIETLDVLMALFKAIDATDEQYNPDARAAVKELAGGDDSLPQLFVGGRHIGNGFTMLKTEELRRLFGTIA